jgi:hypothetical protein
MAKAFFGLTFEAQTDVLLFLLEEKLVEPVVAPFTRPDDFKEPSTGIAFVVDMEGAIGLERQIERFKEEAEKR